MGVDIYHGYQFFTRIVGSSYYQDAVRQCYFDPKSYRRGKSAFIDVVLTLEDSNPYDNQAVAVVSEYGIIGHLRKGNARLYREDYGKDLSVRAKIYSSNGEIFGIWVDLDYDEDDKPKKSRKPPKTQVTASAAALPTPAPKKEKRLTILSDTTTQQTQTPKTEQTPPKSEPAPSPNPKQKIADVERIKLSRKRIHPAVTTVFWLLVIIVIIYKFF